jgi:LytR cell envelope-related transcriptional attenuator
VEHALSNPSGPSGHPWRTIAIVAAGIATLELVGLVAVGVAFLAKPVIHRARKDVAAAAAARPVKKPAKAPVRALPPRRSIRVTVLNGNGVAGAAAAEASRVRARGYKIGKVGNAPRGGYGQSVVMYRAGRRGEAQRLARDLRIRLVSPLDGLRPADLLNGQLAVVVGG